MNIKRLFVVVVISLFFLASCESDNNNHGYGYHYTEITPLGIKIQYNENTLHIDSSYIDDNYIYAQTCTGLYAPSPFVVVVDENDQILTDSDLTLNGIFYTDPSLIVVTDNDFLGYMYVRIDNFEKYSTLNHEFLHYLIHENGYSSDFNGDHHNIFFVTCGEP